MGFLYFLFVVGYQTSLTYTHTGEVFNRIVTRKKYLCRSRGVQIQLNLLALEDWVTEAGLPSGVQAHFAPVKELLNWLQVQDEFHSLRVDFY